MLFSKRYNPQEVMISPYDSLSKRFRIQAYHIIKELYRVDNPYDREHLNHIFKFIHDEICLEHALFSFDDAPGCSEYQYQPVESCLNFIINCKEDDWVVDIIESLILIRVDSGTDTFSYKFGLSAKDTIEELNKRFKENGIGLDFVEDRIIRIDSTLLHVEAITPALLLMQNSQFSGPLDEYLDAHNQYKNGDNKAAITSAAKAFESIMKSICAAKGWDIGKGNASSLINALFANGFLPSYYQTQLSALKTTLEVLPTVRNNNSGHGQGADIIEIPDYLAQYALNLAGTNITFLIKTYEQYHNKQICLFNER